MDAPEVKRFVREVFAFEPINSYKKNKRKAVKEAVEPDVSL